MANSTCQVSNPGPTGAYCGGTTLSLFMLTLETLLRKQTDIEDPCGQIVPVENPSLTYDFIVVGGGSGGSVMANRLSEVLSWNTLLVEAGGNEPTGAQVPSFWQNFPGTPIDWNYTTEAEDKACLGKVGRKCSWSRGKVIGGCTVMNAMAYIRGSRLDYDYWASLGNQDWTYEKVLPYFLKSENNLQINDMDKGYHGSEGPLPVTQMKYKTPIVDDILNAAKNLGFRVGDINGKTHEGFANHQTTTRNGIRWSASRAFLRPIRTRKNLDIMLNTTVTKVLVDQYTNRAYGVQIIKPNGETQIITVNKEVILSGGVVNSPQILQLSGIGDKEELEKVGVKVVHHLPGVGKNLHDHLGYVVPFFTNETAIQDLNMDVAKTYLATRDGPMASQGVPVVGFIKSSFSDSKLDQPDIEMLFGGYQASCSANGTVGELNGQVVNGTLPKRVIVMVPSALYPKSRGYITLADNNPLSHPKIYGKYLTNSDDVKIIIEGIKVAIKLSQTKALSKYNLSLVPFPEKGCEKFTFQSDEYWECAIRTNTFFNDHPVGTCKMGPSTDLLAVVDSRLMVHGLKGLRVADASVMPRVTGGNTNAPTIMIAEKCADYVKAAWRPGILRGVAN